MTNQDQFELNKLLIVSCRGPRRISGDRLRAINSRRTNLEDADNIVELRGLVDGLNKLLGVNVEVESETTAELNLAIIKLIDIRKHCGQDLNELIGAPPYDGLPKEGVCPSCGLLIRWTPALSDEEAASQQQAFLDGAEDLGVEASPDSPGE